MYGHDPRDVIRAFIQISPKRLKEPEEKERRQDELTRYASKEDR